MKAAVKGFEWTGVPLARKLVLLVATGLGLGLSPLASGTAGTLAGVLMVLALPFDRLSPQLVLAVLLVALAFPVCGIAEKHFGRKDDGRIVADEYMTFPLCIVGLPWGDWRILAVAFLTHRVLDIIKPFPAGRLQKLPGGWGVAADDAVSSLYALAINHIIWNLALN